jgi:aldose 1-epimerase
MIRTAISLLVLVSLSLLSVPARADHHKKKKAGKVTVTKAAFGKTKDGQAVEQYTIKSATGLRVKVITYGAMITSVEAPDRNGKSGLITLGFDSLDEYLAGHPYFGCTVGRYCNRIKNATFKIDGKSYKLPANNGDHCLHGGEVGFDKVVWTAETVDGGVKFSHTSKDGDQGFPGNLKASVTMKLSDSELSFEYVATTDKPTVCNLTNHAYWNLAGPGGAIGSHVLKLEASKYTPGDASLVPTGEIAKVAGTAFDFTKAKALGKDLAKVEGGYDLNFVVDGKQGKMRLAATVSDPKSGRVMTIHTTEPGIQLYTGNFLDGTKKGRGVTYNKHGAFCLETQHYPDSPNIPAFPSTTLRPGQTYRSKTVHRFSAK